MREQETLAGRWTNLAAALSHEDAALPNGSGAIPAAVLLLLYDIDGQPHTVLTVRTSHLAAHSGEISLPGGGYEADKDTSLLDTALREAAEEVGIEETELQILGHLPPVNTMVSNYSVTPFVAVARRRPDFQPDPFEVAEILEVPLDALLDPAAVREEDWSYTDTSYRAFYYDFRGYRIWGATARILGQFLAVLRPAQDGSSGN